MDYTISGDRVAELSQDVAEKVFDVCVNAGLECGAGWFQEALNLLNRNQLLYRDLLIDGVIGPITIDRFKISLSQRPPTKNITEARILRILTLLHGG